MVLFWNSYSCVSHRYLQKLLVLLWLDDLHCCLNLSLLSELERVGLKPQKNLHDPMLIATNEGAFPNHQGLFAYIDVLELHSEIQSLVSGFRALHTHHFLYGFSNVEGWVVESEFTCFDLRIVQEVLNDEIHKLSRVLLHFFTFVKSI